MSDNDNTASGKASSAWSDRERLVYLVALMEASSPKLDFANTPRPNGRSAIACQRMVERLKNTLKPELEALKAGGAVAMGDAGPKTPKKTPVKRKTKAAVEGESPTKKGRKKRVLSEEEVGDEEMGDVKVEVKAEVKGEDEDEGGEMV